MLFEKVIDFYYNNKNYTKKISKTFNIKSQNLYSYNNYYPIQFGI